MHDVSILQYIKLAQKSDIKIIKLKLTYVKYEFNMNMVSCIALINICNYIDYPKYKKIYKLLYGI